MPSPSISTFTFPSTTEPVYSASTSEQGGSSYDSRGTSAPTHSAFISAASTNSKMSYPDQSHSTAFTSASSNPTPSSNVMENVLHSFVAESNSRSLMKILIKLGNWIWRN
ncbi:hypothetical protein Tco_0130440 [Tanacetum coccineum]